MNIFNSRKKIFGKAKVESCSIEDKRKNLMENASLRISIGLNRAQYLFRMPFTR